VWRLALLAGLTALAAGCAVAGSDPDGGGGDDDGDAAGGADARVNDAAGNPDAPPSGACAAQPAFTACTEGGGEVCDGEGNCVACVGGTDCFSDGTSGAYLATGNTTLASVKILSFIAVDPPFFLRAESLFR